MLCDGIFGARNSSRQAQPQGTTPASQEWETVGTSMLDAASSTSRYSSARREEDEAQDDDAQDDDAGAAGESASDMDVIYADTVAEDDSQASLQGTVFNRIVDASAPAGDDELAAEVDMLAPMSASDGMFEVIMPSGQRLGVVVSTTTEHVGFLLSPPNNAFGDRIKRQKTALERHLARRIGKLVRLAVL